VRKTWRIWLMLGVLWFFTLPLRPLFDPDEGRYAEVPREMLASGDWVTPRLNGVKYFEKPPLQYWTTAAIYSVFGVSDAAARAWAAALSFLCLPLVFGFATKAGYSREVAVVATAILAISPLFLIVGQVNLLDQSFTFLLVAAIFAFVLAQRATAQPASLRRWMLVTWTLLALAVLTKGIVAPVLAGATLLFYMIATRSLAPMRHLYLRAGLPLFALIVTPWFVLVQQRNPEFAHFFFVHEHLERYLTTVHGRNEPWWYFLGILLVAISPVLGSVRRSWVSFREVPPPAGAFQVETFLLIWCAVVLVFFSLSDSKLAPYILPLMPPLALLLAQGALTDARSLRRAALTLFVSLTVLAIGFMVYAEWRNGLIAPTSAAWASATVVSAFAAWWFARQHRVAAPAEQRWFALAAASIFGYQGLMMTYVSVPPVRSAKALATQLAPRVRPDVNFYSVGSFRHTLGFYLGRTLEVFDYRGELDFGLTQAGSTAENAGLASFQTRWAAEHDALAVMDPKMFASLSGAGLPGHVIASDARSVIVSRR